MVFCIQVLVFCVPFLCPLFPSWVSWLIVASWIKIAMVPMCKVCDAPLLEGTSMPGVLRIGQEGLIAPPWCFHTVGQDLWLNLVSTQVRECSVVPLLCSLRPNLSHSLKSCRSLVHLGIDIFQELESIWGIC